MRTSRAVTQDFRVPAARWDSHSDELHVDRCRSDPRWSRTRHDRRRFSARRRFERACFGVVSSGGVSDRPYASARAGARSKFEPRRPARRSLGTRLPLVYPSRFGLLDYQLDCKAHVRDPCRDFEFCSRRSPFNPGMRFSLASVVIRRYCGLGHGWSSGCRRFQWVRISGDTFFRLRPRDSCARRARGAC
jgi:hypothetical protein